MQLGWKCAGFAAKTLKRKDCIRLWEQRVACSNHAAPTIRFRTFRAVTNSKPARRDSGEWAGAAGREVPVGF
jgi:hypothetical protein